MKWFQRHLNWTITIAFLVSVLIYLPFAILAVSWRWVIGIVAWIFLVVIIGWALRQKYRRLWHLLWTLHPILGGLFVFLVGLLAKNTPGNIYKDMPRMRQVGIAVFATIVAIIVFSFVKSYGIFPGSIPPIDINTIVGFAFSLGLVLLIYL